MGVPLAQLKAVSANRATREAVEDWRYWRARVFVLERAQFGWFGS
jgi:hypothetical protein